MGVSSNQGGPNASSTSNRPSPWCCGNLRMAAVAVGVTNLTCLLFLFLWVVQIAYEDLKHYFIAIVVLVLVVFLLAVVNVCLISGAVARRRSLVLPWLVLYALAVLSIVVACAVTFHSLGRLRPVAVAAVFVTVYFYVCVGAFYHELIFLERERRGAAEATAGGKEEAGGGGDDCLIALTDVNGAEVAFANGRLILDDSSTGGNDTFTELAARPKLLLGDTNPFRSDVPDAAAEASGAASFEATFLPQPDEVIQVGGSTPGVGEAPAVGKVGGDGDEADFASPFGPPASKSKSIDLTPGGARMSLLGAIDESAAPAAADRASCFEENFAAPAPSSARSSSSSRPQASRSHSHSGLVVGDLATNFTPFKSDRKVLNARDGAFETPPKMNIFLPKSPGEDDDDDSEDSSSSSGGEEAAVTRPLRE